MYSDQHASNLAMQIVLWLFEEGDLDRGIWSAGMVVGLIDDIPTCEELIERIVADAEQIIKERLQELASA